jgi:hypothetical protein
MTAVIQAVKELQGLVWFWIPVKLTWSIDPFITFSIMVFLLSGLDSRAGSQTINPSRLFHHHQLKIIHIRLNISYNGG